MRIIVETDRELLHAGDLTVPCAIGRSGACGAANKREGDGCTPLGAWPVRAALLRPAAGFVQPPGVPWRWLRASDGWSDDPVDPCYNRPVRHPHAFSAERMWRDDACYDAVIILGHNDNPPVAPLGSAIFLHLKGCGATEGCVAVSRETMAALLSAFVQGSVVDIRRDIGDAASVG